MSPSGPASPAVWSTGFGSGNGYRRRLLAGPVAAGGTVYVSDALGSVSAFDVATGNRRWRRDTDRTNDDDGTMGSGIAVDGETVFVATGLSELIALNAADGAVRWRVDLPAPARGAPTVSGGTVFVPTVSSHLVALATDDGRRIWSHRAAAIPTIPLGLATPAVEGDVVIAGFPSGELIAMRTSDGRVLWTESLAAAGGGTLSDITGVRARPAVAEGRVVAIGMGGLSICVDLRSGRRLWEQEVGRHRGCLDGRRLGVPDQRCGPGRGDRARERAGSLGRPRCARRRWTTSHGRGSRCLARCWWAGGCWSAPPPRNWSRSTR